MKVTLLAELGVLVEEDVEGGEAAQDVLREVGAVDADDQVLAAAREQLALVLGDLVGRRRRRRRRSASIAERVGAHPDLAALVRHARGVVVDLELEQLAAAVRGSCGT